MRTLVAVRLRLSVSASMISDDAAGAEALVADFLVILGIAAAALSIERWILSLGIDCALAALTAARRRGFMSGSGRPILAATVISRLSLENMPERFLSCAPLRCMMFLNLEWPAIGRLSWIAGV